MLDEALSTRPAAVADGPPLWDGHAGERIASIVRDRLRRPWTA